MSAEVCRSAGYNEDALSLVQELIAELKQPTTWVQKSQKTSPLHQQILSNKYLLLPFVDVEVCILDVEVCILDVEVVYSWRGSGVFLTWKCVFLLRPEGDY